MPTTGAVLGGAAIATEAANKANGDTKRKQWRIIFGAGFWKGDESPHQYN
jgi:hypothetical protein